MVKLLDFPTDEKAKWNPFLGSPAMFSCVVCDSFKIQYTLTRSRFDVIFSLESINALSCKSSYVALGSILRAINLGRKSNQP